MWKWFPVWSRLHAFGTLKFGIMSRCEKPSDKDKVVFLTREDYYREPMPNIKLAELPEDQQARGLILPNGDINFNCPCLGGMASGPCGFEFREAFSCYHYSQNEVKGSECVDKFIQMQECMAKYPNLYSNENAAINSEPNDLAQLEEQFAKESSSTSETNANDQVQLAK